MRSAMQCLSRSSRPPGITKVENNKHDCRADLNSGAVKPLPTVKLTTLQFSSLGGDSVALKLT